MPAYCNITEDFWIKHIRLLSGTYLPNGQGQPGEFIQGLEALYAGPENAPVDQLVQRAGLVLTARAEELGHNHPNTVIFGNFSLIREMGTAIGNVGANQSRAAINIRPYRGPTVITMLQGYTNWEVIVNAAGILVSTNQNGHCCHFDGVVSDDLSRSLLTGYRPGL